LIALFSFLVNQGKTNLLENYLSGPILSSSYYISKKNIQTFAAINSHLFWKISLKKIGSYFMISAAIRLKDLIVLKLIQPLKIRKKTLL